MSNPTPASTVNAPPEPWLRDYPCDDLPTQVAFRLSDYGMGVAWFPAARTVVVSGPVRYHEQLPTLLGWLAALPAVEATPAADSAAVPS